MWTGCFEHSIIICGNLFSSSNSQNIAKIIYVRAEAPQEHNRSTNRAFLFRNGCRGRLHRWALALL